MVLLLFLIFIVSWVLAMISVVIAGLSKYKLKAQLRDTGIIRNGFLKLRPVSMSGLKNFFFMLFSFGNKEFVADYIDNFLNVSAIRRTKNVIYNKLLDKLINYTSYYIKLFIIMFISISIAPMFAQRV